MGYIYALAVVLLTSCRAGERGTATGSFEALSEGFWDVVPRSSRAVRIGIDFQFTEGPAWHPDGTLFFSDIPANTIYRWNGKRYDEFRKPSGNSNGLLLDPQGALWACEHGSRSLTRLSPDGELHTMADSYLGRRLNSPNDLCRAPDGSIYFTDPPFGLSGRDRDKEIPFNGVYCLSRGELSVVDSTLSLPNGIVLSPDARKLYVSNTEGSKACWMRYELDPDGGLTDREEFFSIEDPAGPGGPDGMTVDAEGNLFATGPGGILVLSPSGEHLGTIGLPHIPSNLAFDRRYKRLCVTARSTLYMIMLE